MQDVQALVREGIVETVRLRALFAEVQSDLFRYPAIDPRRLSIAVDRLAGVDKA
jgi:hypothetical protein